MLKVIRLPSVSCVFFMASRTSRVKSCSPQISQVLMTELKTDNGGLSALLSSDSVIQSISKAVDFLLFSALAQHVTTLRQIQFDGRRPRSSMSSSNRTASFH